jgi:tripartite-type tricarboxylate transporter receptor subunit TctC
MRHGVMILVSVTSAILLFVVAPDDAQSQGNEYPAKTVRVIVPFSAGGATDLAARVISIELSRQLGEQFIVDNRTGAGATIGTGLAAKSPPDGYTLLAVSSTNFSISPHIYRNLEYDVIRDFAPIGSISTTSNGLVTHPSLPAVTVKELLSLAKARPADIFYSSSGSGTTAHLAMEMFKTATSIKLTHVPHRGGDSAIMSVVSGVTQVASITLTRVTPLVKAGRLRAIAVTGKRRSHLMPDVPTVMESGVPEYEFQLWGGLVAPAGTPKPIVDKLAHAISDILHKPEIRERFSRDGGEILILGPEQFAALIGSDFIKFRKAVRDAEARID